MRITATGLEVDAKCDVHRLAFVHEPVYTSVSEEDGGVRYRLSVYPTDYGKVGVRAIPHHEVQEMIQGITPTVMVRHEPHDPIGVLIGFDTPRPVQLTYLGKGAPWDVKTWLITSSLSFEADNQKQVRELVRYFTGAIEE